MQYGVDNTAHPHLKSQLGVLGHRARKVLVKNKSGPAQ